MALKTTPVSKGLERRLTILGFEVLDLIAIFLTISVLNLVFGRTELKPYLVWTPSLMMTLILWFGKKGKPYGFLMHWFRFQFFPGVLSAYLPDTTTNLLRKKYDERRSIQSLRSLGI